MIYQTKLFSININMYLFHFPFFLIRTDTQGQHMRDYLEKNMVTTTNFIEMTENTPNQGDLLSTKRYIYNTHFRVCCQHERISPQLKKTVGNYYSRENPFPVTESDLGKYEGKLYLPVYKPLKMVGNTANLFNKCISLICSSSLLVFRKCPRKCLLCLPQNTDTDWNCLRTIPTGSMCGQHTSGQSSSGEMESLLDDMIHHK